MLARNRPQRSLPRPRRSDGQQIDLLSVQCFAQGFQGGEGGFEGPGQKIVMLLHRIRREIGVVDAVALRAVADDEVGAVIVGRNAKPVFTVV